MTTASGARIRGMARDLMRSTGFRRLSVCDGQSSCTSDSTSPTEDLASPNSIAVFSL